MLAVRSSPVYLSFESPALLPVEDAASWLQYASFSNRVLLHHAPIRADLESPAAPRTGPIEGARPSLR
jgi:hypothetical protein